MIRAMQLLGLIGVMAVVPPAHAVDSTGQSPVSKRQMIVQMVDCMKKRMSADRNRSYNEAMKTCKDQMHKDESPAGALMASETQPKQ